MATRNGRADAATLDCVTKLVGDSMAEVMFYEKKWSRANMAARYPS